MVYSYSLLGYRGDIVCVEADIRTGLPMVEIVGLPGNEIRESRERVRVALRNSGFSFPSGKVLINLSPAGIKKLGVAFDLAIAWSILLASGQISHSDSYKKVLVLGELTLVGKVLPVPGVISAIDESLQAGIRHAVVSEGNRQEAQALSDVEVCALENLGELHNKTLTFTKRKKTPEQSEISNHLADLSDYRSTPLIRKILAISAAGRHHTILMGPPGVGKTMGAKCIPSLLPPMEHREAVEVTRLYSLARLYQGRKGLCWKRPLRIPHHSASLEGIIGGGKAVLPGEISLSHQGVLIFDEASKFRTSILQALREPLEERSVLISRAGRYHWFPAEFQLVLTVNLCPCGNFGKQGGICLCSRAEIFQHWKKFGGALLDRIDIRISLNKTSGSFPSSVEVEALKAQVWEAADRQRKRYADYPFRYNAGIRMEGIRAHCRLNDETEQLLKKKSRNMSLRGYYSIIRVARSIADLQGKEAIRISDMHLALELRRHGELSEIIG